MSEAAYLLVKIAGKTAGLRTRDIETVVELSEITPVPGAPAPISGLAVMRSHALTVYDCRLALGLAPPDNDEETRAVAVRHDGHRFALRVDEIVDVCSGEEFIEPIAGDPGPAWRNVALGMAETEHGAVMIVDVARLLEVEPVKAA